MGRTLLAAVGSLVLASCGGQVRTVTITTSRTTPTVSSSATATPAPTITTTTTTTAGPSIPSWVQAAKNGCPTGEVSAHNGGCVGSGSGECAASEPTCNPANVPPAVAAPPSTTTTQQPSANGTCYSFPVYGANADPGQGLFWITVTASGVCFAQAPMSDVGPGAPSQQQSSYQDPLTKGNAPPSGFYDVFPGYEGSPWIFQPVVPK